MMAKNKSISAPAAPTRQYTSVSVDKISNGYLVRTTTDNGSKYQEKTEYFPTKPNIAIPVAVLKKKK
jgi:hypothetical protein